MKSSLKEDINGRTKSRQPKENYLLESTNGISPYMTESEVRNILTQYNTDMNMVLMENEKLKVQLGEALKTSRETEFNSKKILENLEDLQKERDHYKLLSDQLDERLRNKIKEQIEVEVATKMNTYNTSTTSNIDKVKKVINFYQRNNLKIVEKGIAEEINKKTVVEYIDSTRNVQQNYQELLEKFQGLAKHNEELVARISELETTTVAMKECLICHESFSPLMNTPKSCQHHPGRLKYYSCRQFYFCSLNIRSCGADEYYSCCNKCTNCCKGCKFSKHAFS